MPGDLDPAYVLARTALLDAAEALAPHLDAVVLVGAQAIYLHTGEADLAVAASTTDADFSVEPRTLGNSPLLDALLTQRGFTPRQHPGGWLSTGGVYLDIMVPEPLAGPGRRGADLGAHGRRAARRAKGLEGALVDRQPQLIASLDVDDNRTVTMNVTSARSAAARERGDSSGMRCLRSPDQRQLVVHRRQRRDRTDVPRRLRSFQMWSAHALSRLGVRFGLRRRRLWRVGPGSRGGLRVGRSCPRR